MPHRGATVSPQIYKICHLSFWSIWRLHFRGRSIKLKWNQKRVKGYRLPKYGHLARKEQFLRAEQGLSCGHAKAEHALITHSEILHGDKPKWRQQRKMKATYESCKRWRWKSSRIAYENTASDHVDRIQTSVLRSGQPRGSRQSPEWVTGSEMGEGKTVRGFRLCGLQRINRKSHKSPKNEINRFTLEFIRVCFALFTSLLNSSGLYNLPRMPCEL